VTNRISESPIGWVADHVRQYLETDGEQGHEWRPGVPTLLLTTVGRRTGQLRRTALIYGMSGPDHVVVASKGGAPSHPAWYLNLQANPRAEIQVGGERHRVVARTAQGEERSRLWDQMRAIWPDYEVYATRTDREIPVVVLTVEE
jgi:deazaflavin-dependent oxidoreductase (nitroreductase family)